MAQEADYGEASMAYENKYKIDKKYLESVQEQFDAHDLANNHPVLELLKNLHNYTYKALEKAYDWYTFGEMQRISHKLVVSNHVQDVVNKVTKMTRGSINKQLHVLNRLLPEVDRSPNDATSLTALLIQVQFRLNVQLDLFENIQGDQLQAQSNALEKTPIPSRFWCRVAHIYDQLKMKLEDRWEVNFCALLAYYTKEELLHQLVVDEIFGGEYGGNSSEELLDSGYELGAILFALEREMLQNAADWQDDLRAYAMLGDPDLGFGTPPGLLSRMALAAALYKTFEEKHPADGSTTDLCNWLFHWLWRNLKHRDIRDLEDDDGVVSGAYAREGSDHRPLMAQPNQTTTYNLLTLETHCPIGHQIHVALTENHATQAHSIRSEYKMADVWYTTAGRGGTVATTQQRITHFFVGSRIRGLWSDLVTQRGEVTQRAAVLAAASKLGLAYLGVKTETNASQYFRPWNHSKPSDLAKWIQRLDEHVDGGGNTTKLQKTAVTDVIATIGDIASIVTGKTSGVSTLELVCMAREHFFNSITCCDKSCLQENLQTHEGWGSPWNEMSSTFTGDPPNPEGLPHQWLWGREFFQQVNTAVEDGVCNFSWPTDQSEVVSSLSSLTRTWAMHLLCIAWSHDRGQGGQLKDRPATPELMQMIKYVFRPAAMPGCEPLQKLKPIVLSTPSQPSSCSELTSYFAPRHMTAKRP